MIMNYQLHYSDLVQAALPEDIAKNFRSNILIEYFFYPRFVRSWNRLLEFVVSVESLDSFKMRLDNWQRAIVGSGSRPC